MDEYTSLAASYERYSCNKRVEGALSVHHPEARLFKVRTYWHNFQTTACERYEPIPKSEHNLNGAKCLNVLYNTVSLLKANFEGTLTEVRWQITD